MRQGYIALYQHGSFGREPFWVWYDTDVQAEEHFQLMGKNDPTLQRPVLLKIDNEKQTCECIYSQLRID